jgi:hypothetical protein
MSNHLWLRFEESRRRHTRGRRTGSAGGNPRDRYQLKEDRLERHDPDQSGLKLLRHPCKAGFDLAQGPRQIWTPSCGAWSKESWLRPPPASRSIPS